MPKCTCVRILTTWTGFITLMATGPVAKSYAASDALFPPILVTQNQTGFATTVSTQLTIDRNNPFFRELGTNGRTCVDCHQPDAAWSITPRNLKQLFDKTSGLDPVFRTNDGSNSPHADVSSVEKRRQAYSMLLKKV